MTRLANRRMAEPERWIDLSDVISSRAGAEQLVFSLGELMDRFTGADQCLALGVRLASALSQLHSTGFPHGNLTPSTIHYHVEKDRLTLSGSAAPSMKRTERTAGTSIAVPADPAYMSPEQLRRVHHGVDCRTDLYSLGVVLYELLTGEQPFSAADPLEWAHCHLAQIPKAPCELNREIPTLVSDIIMKLLAKDCDDRYQTAQGVKADLLYCYSELKKGEFPSPIVLAQWDVSDQLFIPQKLYGRQQEVDQLLAALHRVMERGRPELFLITGYSGIGKTTLVRELYRPVIHQHGFFIWGKFDQNKRNIPYAGIIDSLQDVISQILTESEEDLERWKSNFLGALGVNGRLITDILPGLEHIIGAQQPVADLPLQAAANRFKMVFRNFLGVFARKEHPLLLFLDDLQWVDSASLGLLEYLLEDPGPCFLLLIGAYRDNEVGPAHPLQLRLNEIKRKPYPVGTITLAPLDFLDLSRLLADSLKREVAEVESLARLVYEKTRGNAFFTIQFLRTLHSEGLIAVDPDACRWSWDIEGIQQAGYADNVIDLMVGNLRKLSLDAQHILKTAACIGNTFELTPLAQVTGFSEQEVEEILFEPLQVGLVLYGLTVHSFSFLHDRVQQSAYSLLPEEKRIALHLDLARHMADSVSAGHMEDRIFDIVNQYNLGLSRVKERSERFRVAELNLLAGKKAAAASAYRVALSYMERGAEVTDENGWQDHYPLMYALHKELAVALYINSHYPRAQALIGEILVKVRTAVEQAELYNILIIQYTLLARYDAAIDSGITALKQLGVNLVLDDIPAQLELQLTIHDRLLAGRSIDSLIHEPELTDPRHRTALELLSNMVVPSRYTDNTLFALISVINANLSLEYGLSAKSTVGFTSLGMYYNSSLNRFEEAYAYGELALKISERFKAPAQKCQACFMLGHYLSHWVNHLRDSDGFNDEGIHAGLSSGEMQWSGYTMAYKLFQPFYRGAHLEQILLDLPELVDFTRKTQNRWALDTLLGMKLAIESLIEAGPLENGRLEHDEGFVVKGEKQYLSTCEEGKSFGALGRYAVLKVQVLYLYGRLKEALEWVEKAAGLCGYFSSSITVVQLNFYHSLLLTTTELVRNGVVGREAEQRVRDNQSQLKRWMEHCPENYSHLHTLIEAQLLPQGNGLEAGRLYDLAQRQAGEQGFVQDQGIIHLAAAQWYERHALFTPRDGHLGRAGQCFEQWGAHGVVRYLNSVYPTAREVHKPVSSPLELSIGSLDAISVVKSSQAISEEIVLENLVKTLMRTVLESAGARKGVLLTLEGEKLRLEAEALVNSTSFEVRCYPETERVVPAEALPISVVNYVRRSREAVIVDNSAEDATFSADPYIAQAPPSSMLCMPIMRQGRLIGLLYLENNLVRGAFSVDRIAVLELLAAQAAISLENAHLYQQRSMAEEAIKKSEQRYRAIFENSGTPFIFIEDDMTVSMMNREFELLVGWTKEEVEGKMAWIDFVADPDELKTMIGYHKLRRMDPEVPPKSYEFQLITRSREVRNVIANVTVLPGTRQSLAAVLDITDRKKAEMEQQRLVRAIEQTSEAVFIADRQFNLIYANKSFEQLSGYDQEEIIGLSARVLRSPRHDSEFYRGILECLLAGESWSGHVSNVRKDGTVYEAVSTASPVRDKEGEVAYFVVTLRDITHELQLEAELRQAQKMEAVGTLAGGIAHDFNNILTSIIGNAELVHRTLPEEAPQQKRLKQLLKSCDRAANLVTQILTFSRKTEQSRKPIHIIPVIREIFGLLRSTIPTTIDIRLQEEVSEDEDIVLADSTQMHQVMMNLCSNAAQAMEGKEGLLEVTVAKYARCGEHRFHGLESLEGECIRITVKDTGPGISKQDQEKIFDPYFTTKNVGKGTGLGLAVVRGIVKNHEGVIYVESEPGKGTAFHICLPPCRPGSVEQEPEKTENISGGKGNVLLVDDEATLVEIGTEIITALGYRVVGRTDSREALELFRLAPEEFDLVITDMTMPGLTGQELATRLHAVRADIPVVLCTGYTELLTAEQAAEMGIKGYLNKPYTINKLASVISKALDE